MGRHTNIQSTALFVLSGLFIHPVLQSLSNTDRIDYTLTHCGRMEMIDSFPKGAGKRRDTHVEHLENAIKIIWAGPN